MESLITELKKYSKSNFYGFHMPGHKRNQELCGNSLPYNIDITEIDGFDDLHHCEGIILDAQERAAKVFGAQNTFYLINGSTVGNISAIMGTTNSGDKILIARNNHKSVYNAVFLKSLCPIYIYPQFDLDNQINGEIIPEQVEDMLIIHPDIKAIVIVSPTYDGVVSDVKSIADIAHKYMVPLIVDEAHGAHFGFHSYFPQNANQLGADVVIHSIHKTLPSLTQTGLMHVNGSLVDSNRIKRYLSMLQSSSPSYVLMASIERCVSILETQGNTLFCKYVNLLEQARAKLKGLKFLYVVDTNSYDRAKILISTLNSGMESKELFRLLLEEYHLQLEMVGSSYVLAMTSICDTQEGIDRLITALYEIDKMCCLNINNKLPLNNKPKLTKTNISKLPKLKKAENGEKGSEFFYYLYPPGIPFVVPGEVITKEIMEIMNGYEQSGFKIYKE